MSNDIEYRMETVGAVKRRQVIWADWMQEACDGLTDDDTVQTILHHGPFGTFLMDIRATPI